jgi:hypothetical protein
LLDNTHCNMCMRSGEVFVAPKDTNNTCFQARVPKT